ncbi:MAG: sigma-70 family RNA polymerase sigma factor [Planctomycetota bacterium]
MSDPPARLLAAHDADDAVLLQRIGSGDERGFELLYDRHVDSVYGLILRIVKHRGDAEDVLQEVWIQVWRRAASFDPERGAVVAWLFTIARTRALDCLRRHGGKPRGMDPLPVDRLEEVPRAMVEGHALDVRAALDAIPARERKILEIAYFDGLTQLEIARQLNAPIGSVKTWMRRGLLRLRSILTKGPDGA